MGSLAIAKQKITSGANWGLGYPPRCGGGLLTDLDGIWISIYRAAGLPREFPIVSYERSFSFLVVRSNFQLAIATFVICIAVTGASAQSSGPYIYPSKGQTQKQQDRDKYECNQWAVSQSGFDPSKPPTSSRNAQQPQGQAVRGAARGAAAGAIGGAIAGDAGTGAAAGAAMGGGAGAIRRRRARREVQQQQAQAQAVDAAGEEAYRRALAACLQGRGYTVN